MRLEHPENVHKPEIRRHCMARAKTSSFTLTHDLLFDNVNPTGTIAIGSLIDVGDAQALEIEAVDYLWTGYKSADDDWHPVGQTLDGDSSFLVQLMDKNSGGNTISPADNNLVSSAQMHYGQGDNIVTAAGDFYPDDFKNTTGRFVVNDELYVVGEASLSDATGYELACTIRITAKIVKLTTRDWMAISLETVQNE